MNNKNICILYTSRYGYVEMITW